MPNQVNNRVTGIGSALIDILLPESDAFCAATGAQKGGMTLVDYQVICDILSRSNSTPRIVPGGSACNTIMGIGNLGGKARFVGTSGNDADAASYEEDLRKSNVEPLLFHADSPTGRVLSIITPDAQRSMFTFLGASADAQPAVITPAVFDGSAIVHIEGYLLFNEVLMRAALESAKKAGARISLDLASYTVVENTKPILQEIVSSSVDILIANEDEARTYTGIDNEEEALERCARSVEIAVVKLGKRGCLIKSAHGVERIGIMGSGEAVDTTGAGDLWAAGFLYGIVNDLSYKQSGELGAACGYEVCQTIGAQISPEGWERIHNRLSAL